MLLIVAMSQHLSLAVWIDSNMRHCGGGSCTMPILPIVQALHLEKMKLLSFASCKATAPCHPAANDNQTNS